MTKIQSDVKRTPMSHIPKEVATRCLQTSPRISNSSRKRFITARAAKIEVEQAEPKDIQEKYCRKLRGLTFHSLGRQLAQAARQIKRFERALAMDGDNEKLRQGYTMQIYRHGWVEQEIQRRGCKILGYQNPDGN